MSFTAKISTEFGILSRRIAQELEDHTRSFVATEIHDNTPRGATGDLINATDAMPVENKGDYLECKIENNMDYAWQQHEDVLGHVSGQPIYGKSFTDHASKNATGTLGKYWSGYFIAKAKGIYFRYSSKFIEMPLAIHGEKLINDIYRALKIG